MSSGVGLPIFELAHAPCLQCQAFLCGEEHCVLLIPQISVQNLEQGGSFQGLKCAQHVS